MSLYAALPSSRSSLAVSERFESEWREQKSRSFELTDTSSPTQTRLFCSSDAFCCKRLSLQLSTAVVSFP